MKNDHKIIVKYWCIDEALALVEFQVVKPLKKFALLELEGGKRSA